MNKYVALPGEHWVALKQRAGQVARQFRARTTPPFEPDEAEAWYSAANWLIERGDLRAGEYGVRALLAEQPDMPWASTMAELFDLMPGAHRVLPDIRDHRDQDVQVVARPGSDLAILVFCGQNHRLGAPTAMMHRWLARLGGSVVYLRDPRDLCFLGGVSSLGEGMRATQQALKPLLACIGATRIICYGVSGGGYGALRYALDMGGDAVTVGSPVNMSPEFNEHLNHRRVARKLRAAFPDEQLDLRALYDAGPSPSRALVVYSERHWNERIHAEYMRGARHVELREIPGTEKHADVAEILRRGEFEALFEPFIQSPGGSSVTA